MVSCLWRGVVAQAAPPFEPAECPFPIPIGYRIDCGFVSVPEDRTQANGPAIKLGLALVHSSSAKPASDPIFFLNGGPGGAIVAALPNMLQAFDPILSTRDMLFFDQRGAGWSQPSLICPEVEAIKFATLQGRHFSLEETLAPYLACRDRLQRAGVNLAAYNTVENAADIEALRRALGYDQINLYGVSYGTMLAQVVVRDYPDHIRSAVLDSAYPIWEYVFADAPLSLAHYFDTIFTNCEQDGVCRLIYPDARAVFAQIVDRVRQPPPVLANFDPVTHETFTVTLNHIDLTGWLVYSAPRRVPALLYDLRDGDYTELLVDQRTALENAHRPQWPLSEGMKLSVACSLRLIQVTPQQMAETNAKYSLAEWANRDSTTNLAVCAQWPAREVDARDAEPLHTDVPLLVIGGEYDPGSPPRYAETVAAASTHGYAFSVPTAGHGVLVVADPCANGIVYSFLHDPLRQPDSSCLSHTRGAGFVVRAAISRPVVLVLVAMLSAALAWSAWRGAKYARRHEPGLAWRISLRLLGWWPVAAGVGAVAAAWLLGPLGIAPLEPRRVLETIVPLLAGVHAAFLFSPEDEPGLEVTLACPRPLAWTILERLAWLLALQGGLAVIGSVVMLNVTGETLSVTLSRWIVPLLFFVGLGVCLTLMTRQAVMSVGLITVLWCGLMLASEVLVKQWPFLWPLALYLQPDQPDYGPNRIFLILIGLWLIRLAATYFIRDEERVLLGRRGKSKRRPRAQQEG
ncbi:Tripeptidyl aminopeptidase [Thermoflexales bacterium]|nr:Tripeptidyl aminopeptidase [Thermoflexales bacterium]